MLFLLSLILLLAEAELPDLDKVIPFLRELFDLAFGRKYAEQALRATTWILLLIVFLGLIWAITWLVSRISTFVSKRVRPLVYDDEQRARARRRRYFAEHVEQEIRLINSREDWKDQRFAELEAEVEAAGRRRSFLEFRLRSLDKLRRYVASVLCRRLYYTVPSGLSYWKANQGRARVQRFAMSPTRRLKLLPKLKASGR